MPGLAAHLSHEWVIVANLACLLLGFALLSRHFEKSHAPLALPRLLPDDWKGCFALLAIVFVLSAFLDNIAAALIGGAMAHSLFKRVHIGYLAAIVAASNAGGSGSVVGDTTTTMMWIDGVSPLDVLHAYSAAIVALFVSGLVAAFQQHRHSPIMNDVRHQPRIDWVRLGDRDRDARRRDRRQRRRQPARARARRPLSVHRRGGVDRDPGLGAAATARLGAAAARRAGARSFSCRWCWPHR